MSLTLQQIIDGTVRFRNKNMDSYPDIIIRDFSRQDMLGVHTRTWSGVAEGSGSYYKVLVQFFDLYNENEKPTADSRVALKCDCFTGDTLIPLLDGYSVPIKDLVNREYFYVYSFDTVTNKIVIGKAHSCEIKRKNSKIIEITFDNGSKVKCTPDHKFMLRDGSYKEAQYLTKDMSLQAVYRKSSTKDDNKDVVGYEMVLQKDGWEFTHRLTDLYTNFKNLPGGSVRHHKDFNKRNNNPENITVMSWWEHLKIHHNHMLGDGNPMKNKDIAFKVTQQNKNNCVYEKASIRMKIDNPMFNEDTAKSVGNKIKSLYKSGKLKSQKGMKKDFSEESRKNISEAQRKLISEGKHIGLNRMQEVNREKIKNGTFHLQSKEHSEKMTQRNLDLSKKGEHPFQNKEVQENAYRIRCVKLLKKHIQQYGSLVREKWVTNRFTPKLESMDKRFGLDNLLRDATNHKIVSIKEIGNEDVYCFTVDKYHNFMIDLDNGKDLSSGVIVHNCADFRFNYEKPLYDNQALIGSFRKYERVPGSNRPPKNPLGIPGMCKHLWQLIRDLSNAGEIK